MLSLKIFDNKPLLVILLLAFLLRIAGINYGLPLWLISDEPPFITAALKMIETKTVLPALHQNEFKPILYFPPYLAYLYIIPYVLLLGIKYLFLGAGMQEFQNYIVSDLSHFFLLARLINVILGTLTVGLVYKISKNIFKKEWVALLGSSFLALSVLHINLSFVARDWAAATFLFTLGMWFITHPNRPLKKRYLLGGLIAGLAFGVSLIAGFLMLFMLYWYIFQERHSLIDVFKEKTLYQALFIFLFLAALSVAVYPFGFHILGDNSLSEQKSLSELAIQIFAFFYPILKSEPALVIFAAIGLIFSYKNFRGFLWTALAFIFSYSAAFYLIFHYQQRFVIYLFPILAILAGYGIISAVNSFRANFFVKGLLTAILLLTPLAASLRLDWLVLKNDSRTQARQWIESNLPPKSKIIVFAELTRLSSTREAVEEQQSIDPHSLRKVDYGEAAFEKNPYNYTQFHALNLYSVANEAFYKNIKDYAAKNKYQYVFLDPSFQGRSENADKVRSLIKNAELLRSFGEAGESEKKYSVYSGDFGNPLGLFKIKTLGPQIEIYKLRL